MSEISTLTIKIPLELKEKSALPPLKRIFIERGSVPALESSFSTPAAKAEKRPKGG